jgi:hypothetical protein
VDNEILSKKYSRNKDAMNRIIFGAMKPMLNPKNYPESHNQDDAPAFRGEVLENMTFPPILIPCHYVMSKRGGSEADLVEGALNNKLYPCDHKRADKAFVFVHGLIYENKMIEAVRNFIADIPKINVYRKIGDGNKEEILILLRNPYGRTELKDGESDTLESRFIEVMDSALEHMNEGYGEIVKNSDGTVSWDNQRESLVNQADYKTKTKDALMKYFYGPEGLKYRIEEAVEKLKSGKVSPRDLPLFAKSLDIFVNDSREGSESNLITTESKIFTPSEIAEIERIVMKKIVASEKGNMSLDSA